MIRDLIKLLDEDGNGKLSQEEFMGYYLHRQMDFDKVCKIQNEMLYFGPYLHSVCVYSKFVLVYKFISLL